MSARPMTLKTCPHCGGRAVLTLAGGALCRGCGAHHPSAARWNLRTLTLDDLERHLAEQHQEAVQIVLARVLRKMQAGDAGGEAA